MYHVLKLSFPFPSLADRMQILEAFKTGKIKTLVRSRGKVGVAISTASRLTVTSQLTHISLTSHPNPTPSPHPHSCFPRWATIRSTSPTPM